MLDFDFFIELRDRLPDRLIELVAIATGELSISTSPLQSISSPGFMGAGAQGGGGAAHLSSLALIGALLRAGEGENTPRTLAATELTPSAAPVVFVLPNALPVAP
eukprot:516370_1